MAVNIKILIVEDEPNSREGLVNLIKSANPVFEVYSADDGIKGYALAKETRPHILISDIKMPHLNGLDMIERLIDEGINCKYVILSGYADFSFAQKAIRYGAMDYMLKPVAPGLMINLISNLVNDIVADSVKFFSDNQLSLSTSDDNNYLVEHLQSKNLTSYLAAIVYAGKNKSLSKDLRNLFLDSKNYMRIILPDNNFKAILVGYTPNQKANIDYDITRLKSYILKNNQYTCIYMTKKKESSWLDTFFMLKKSLSWSILYRDRFFEYVEDMTTNEDFAYDSKLYMKKLSAAYINEDYDACLKIILDELEQMTREQKNPYLIKQVAIMGLKKIPEYTNSSKRSSDSLYIDAVNELSNAVTRSEIQLAINKHFARHNSDKDDSNYSAYVKIALDVIENNYREQISLNSTAEIVGISPQHLSRLFAKELSMTFLEVLTNTRIEKAKVLLDSSNMKINMICQETGYPDAKYFCTIFKKNVGVSPNQYRTSKHYNG
jgi:YesN/AraC family two-component response regulator